MKIFSATAKTGNAACPGSFASIPGGIAAKLDACLN